MIQLDRQLWQFDSFMVLIYLRRGLSILVACILDVGGVVYGLVALAKSAEAELRYYR